MSRELCLFFLKNFFNTNMHYSHYILLRLKLFMFSPKFYFIIAILISIACRSIDSIILCDHQTLEDLNKVLLEDTTKFNKTMEEYKYYDDAR